MYNCKPCLSIYIIHIVPYFSIDLYSLPPIEVQSFDDWRDSELGEGK